MPPWPEESQDDLDDLGAHPDLLAELRGARAAGVSWRRFTGWEPARTTTVERDEAGRVVRLVTTTEPEWDDEQRAAVYALQRYEAGLCPGCKQELSETTAPENEFRYREAETVRCHLCASTETVHKGYEDDPHPGSLLTRMELIPDA